MSLVLRVVALVIGAMHGALKVSVNGLERSWPTQLTMRGGKRALCPTVVDERTKIEQSKNITEKEPCYD
ncbi:hypothetical protein BC363_06260 [Ensifer sp. LC384]|nr:hypothetical protein BC363_06260 [Ensifer sp. LC384]